MAVLVAVVAPIVEEFFFRGFIFGALRNWRGMWPAAILTGLVFGAIHAGSSDPAYLAAARRLRARAVPALREDRVALPVHRLHCANNSLAFGVTQDWGWEILVLFGGSLALIALVLRGRVRAVAARRAPAAARPSSVRHGPRGGDSLGR